MKKLIKLSVWCAMFTALFAACSDDPTDATGGVGLISKSCADVEEISNAEQEFKVTIETDAAWTAKLSKTDYATLEPASGGKGKNELVISFRRNGTATPRTLILTITVEGHQAESLCQIRQQASEGGSGNGDDVETPNANKWMDSYLSSHYLWNAEYRDNTSKDFYQPADSYLNDVLWQLYQKGVNHRDGYSLVYNNQTYWVFYSYIEKTASTRAAATRSKTTAQDYGLMPWGFAYYDQKGGTVCLLTEYTTPGSSAYNVGLRRGDAIIAVNGTTMTEANYQTVAEPLLLLYPNQTIIVTVVALDGSGKTTDITLSPTPYYPTPVIHTAVWKIKDKTIGHLVYTGFDSDYDSDVENSFKFFKEKGVTDIVVDLRFNGGGAVSSSQLISSILAGNDCMSGSAPKIFNYYRYNDERMKAQGRDINDYKTYFALPFSALKAQEYGFNFDKIHVIGTENTASASELIINALRGIDKKVVVVGQTTNGKDVGMEAISNTSPYDGGYYVFAPITFQSYNAKGESDYDNGFTPDVKTIDYMNEEFPYSWTSVYLADKNTQIIDTSDYLIDAFISILGGKFTLDDIKGAELIGNNDTRAGAQHFKCLSKPEKQPILNRIPLDKSDWRKTNMYVWADEMGIE